MTTQQAYSLGYFITMIFFIPLIAWAKVSEAGVYALIIVVLIGFLCCLIIRMATGQWP